MLPPESLFRESSPREVLSEGCSCQVFLPEVLSLRGVSFSLLYEQQAHLAYTSNRGTVLHSYAPCLRRSYVAVGMESIAATAQMVPRLDEHRRRSLVERPVLKG